jgi:hypothetical protein
MNRLARIRVDRAQQAIFQMVELVIVVLVAVWAIIGAWNYAKDTNWKLTGLLTMLDEKWKGALLLSALVFYRSVREALSRARKGPFGIELGDPFQPAETKIIRGPERQ